VTKKNWQVLLKRLQLDGSMSKLAVVDSTTLDEFESEHGIKLPKSYRTYCQVFGAGEFGSQFKVAVPGYQGIAEAYSLDSLNEMAHEGQDYDHTTRKTRNNTSVACLSV
jgi:SMI1 / KNR4 family (SUKH-1)